MGRLLLVTGHAKAGLIDSEEKKIVDWFLDPGPESDPFKLIHAGAWSPDGKRIAIGLGKEVSIRNPENLYEEEKRLPGHKDIVQNMAWSPKGDALATSSTYPPKGEKYLKIWDTGSWELIKEFEINERKLSYPSSLSWSPNGEKLAVGMKRALPVIINADDWEVERRIELKVDPKQAAGIRVAWDPRGETLAVAKGGRVRFWGEDGRLLKEVEVSPLPSFDHLVFCSLSWSPSGRFLACGCEDDGVIIIDTETWDLVKKREEDTYAVAWSPDGDLLASARQDFYFWDTETWEREVVSRYFKWEDLRHPESTKEHFPWMGEEDFFLGHTRSLSWQPV